MSVNMSLDISKTKNQVIIQFQEPVNWLGLSSKQAKELAFALYEHARRLDGDKPDIIMGE